MFLSSFDECQPIIISVECYNHMVVRIRNGIGGKVHVWETMLVAAYTTFLTKYWVEFQWRELEFCFSERANESYSQLITILIYNLYISQPTMAAATIVPCSTAFIRDRFIGNLIVPILLLNFPSEKVYSCTLVWLLLVSP